MTYFSRGLWERCLNSLTGGKECIWWIIESYKGHSKLFAMFTSLVWLVRKPKGDLSTCHACLLLQLKGGQTNQASQSSKLHSMATQRPHSKIHSKDLPEPKAGCIPWSNKTGPTVTMWHVQYRPDHHYFRPNSVYFALYPYHFYALKIFCNPNSRVVCDVCS